MHVLMICRDQRRPSRDAWAAAATTVRSTAATTHHETAVTAARPRPTWTRDGSTRTSYQQPDEEHALLNNCDRPLAALGNLDE